MDLRFRIVGILISACGLAVCYGATALWPADPLTPLGVLRMAAAGVAALLGVGNLFAGLVVVFLRPARE